MAVDTAQKRAMACNFAIPSTVPAIVPDGSIDQPDRFQMMWSYTLAAGVILFFATVMGNGVSVNSYDGVTMDENGNLRVSGSYFP